jgi:hypothetical protein
LQKKKRHTFAFALASSHNHSTIHHTTLHQTTTQNQASVLHIPIQQIYLQTDKMWDSNQKYNRAISPSTLSRHPPRQLLKLSFVILLVGYVMYVLVFEIHSASYVWQSTVLADFIYSDLRTSCDYNIASSSFSSSSQPQKKFKVGIIVLFGKGAVGEWGDDIMKQVLRNRQEYANMHGYEVINANSVIDPTRPVAWSKLLAIKHNLDKFDYIMYIDMDAVIMEPSITVENLIYASEQGEQADIIMQTDWNGPNTGIWLAKNTEWTKDFLSLAWDQHQLVARTAANGVSHPFE